VRRKASCSDSGAALLPVLDCERLREEEEVVVGVVVSASVSLAVLIIVGSVDEGKEVDGTVVVVVAGA
jgi:hypothetical protein